MSQRSKRGRDVFHLLRNAGAVEFDCVVHPISMPGELFVGSDLLAIVDDAFAAVAARR